MNAVRAYLTAALASLVLAGCPESTTPSDVPSGGDTLASDATDMGTTSSTIAHTCMLYSDYLQRCNQMENCFLDQFVANCPSVLTHYRPDLLSYLDTCLPSSSCANDAGAMTGPCSAEMFLSVSPTTQQQAAADALCAACPAIAGTMATTQSECVNAIFAGPDGGATTSGVGILLRYFDDATANDIRVRCATPATMDGGSCTTSVLFCMLDAIGYGPIFAACSSDAGTRD